MTPAHAANCQATPILLKPLCGNQVVQDARNDAPSMSGVQPLPSPELPTSPSPTGMGMAARQLRRGSAISMPGPHARPSPKSEL